MRLPCELGIEWLEPLGRAQEQWRGVAATSHVKGNLGVHALRPGLTKLIERTRIGGREQRLRGRRSPASSFVCAA